MRDSAAWMMGILHTGLLQVLPSERISHDLQTQTPVTFVEDFKEQKGAKLNLNAIKSFLPFTLNILKLKQPKAALSQSTPSNEIYFGRIAVRSFDLAINIH